MKAVVEVSPEEIAPVKLVHNPLFLMLMQGVFLYTALCAVIIGTLKVPPDDILDSGLTEIVLVFEDYDDYEDDDD